MSVKVIGFKRLKKSISNVQTLLTSIEKCKMETIINTFEIVLNCTLHKPIDLAPLSLNYRGSKPAHSFTQYIYDLHAKTQCKIALSNEQTCCKCTS